MALPLVAVLWTHPAKTSHADSITLIPVADTTLIETAPDNNMGGSTFFNAGTTGITTRNRGLLRFDLSEIPSGSVIISVNLLIEVVFEPPPPAESFFSLHRVLKPWGEGDKAGSEESPGLGDSAAINEATWNHRFALTTNAWTAPGGAPNIDYVSNESAFAFIGSSQLEFESTAELEADVQSWVDQPQTNFGWMLITQSESTRYTARRFASREESDFEPMLTIDFRPPLRITDPELKNGRIEFTFTTQPAQPYVIEYQNSLPDTSWLVLTNIPPHGVPATVTVSDSASGPQRFYRVRPGS